MAEATRYLVFEARAREGVSLLAVFEYVGDVSADSADHALRDFYKEPPETEQVAFAVAASRCQPRPIKAREPKTSLGAPIEMPTIAGVLEGQESMFVVPPGETGGDAERDEAPEAAVA